MMTPLAAAGGAIISGVMSATTSASELFADTAVIAKRNIIEIKRVPEVLVFVLLMLAVNLLVDVLYVAIDPRVRYG